MEKKEGEEDIVYCKFFLHQLYASDLVSTTLLQKILGLITLLMTVVVPPHSIWQKLKYQPCCYQKIKWEIS